MLYHETAKENYLYHPFPHPKGNKNMYPRGEAPDHDKDPVALHEKTIGRIIAEFNGTIVESSFTLYRAADVI